WAPSYAWRHTPSTSTAWGSTSSRSARTTLLRGAPSRCSSTSTSPPTRWTPSRRCRWCGASPRAASRPAAPSSTPGWRSCRASSPRAAARTSWASPWGAWRRGGLLPRHGAMVAGDALIALPSSGLHSNGFSLVRFIIRAAGLDYNQAAPFDPTRSLGDALLTPARIYVQPLLALSREGLLKGAAPVASGGLQRCCDGVLPEHLVAKLQEGADAWEMPAAQRWLAAVGKVKCSELAATFNCGIGMLLVVAAADRERAMQALRDLHEEPVLVGELGSRKADSLPLEVEGADLAWLMLPELGASLPFPEVLSSLTPGRSPGRKSWCSAAARRSRPCRRSCRHWRCPHRRPTCRPSCARTLTARCWPTPGEHGPASHGAGQGSVRLHRILLRGPRGPRFGRGRGTDAEGGGPAPGTGADDGAGQGSSSISADFSRQFDELMTSLTPDFIVVLDDVDRTLLTRQLLQRYMGRVLLVHASLLPAFPGPCPIEAALRAGVCITGCTVSFAAPPSSLGAEHRHGPVILQEATKVHANDTASTLRARLVAECEAAALSRAVQLVASGSVVLKSDDGGYSLGRSRLLHGGRLRRHARRRPRVWRAQVRALTAIPGGQPAPQRGGMERPLLPPSGGRGSGSTGLISRPPCCRTRISTGRPRALSTMVAALP
ncbi:unnamed protein product, partial [Prorocentrum cordatum]